MTYSKTLSQVVHCKLQNRVTVTESSGRVGLL